MSVLALDVSGIPRRWISADDAIFYHATDSVAWSLGEVMVKYRGGTQHDGSTSYLESTSIIAIKGHGFNTARTGNVALTNRTLFGRDRNCCAYCGNIFTNYKDLSRDHVIPVFKGGPNIWTNVVTSCKRCNSFKGHMTLKEAGMELLYLPYVPSYSESLILANRTILADQMDYLMASVPKHSRLRLS
jgi:5-methylcytosine-specific restriction endonuclease McrA